MVEENKRHTYPNLRRAPYRFVETGKRALPSPSDDLDLSRPVEGSLTGVLSVEWQAETPLLVGGGVSLGNPEAKRDSNQPLKIGDQFALPGSTLKGMIRSVMEIASFARLSFVDDCAAATRNMYDTTWNKQVEPSRDSKPKGGWLFRTLHETDGKFEQRYVLVQADETLSIAFSDLLPLLGNKMDKDHWHLAPAFERYKAIDQAGLGGLCEPEKLGLSPDHGRARLVVSSLTAEPGRGGRTEKNREYIFVWPETEDRPIQNSCVTIDTRVAERFLGSLNRDSNAKKDSDTARNPETLYDVLVAEGRATCFEQPEIPEGEQTDRRKSLIEQLKDPNKWGLPVYWRNPETGGNQQYCSATPILSLTPFLRVPYKYSVQDMVQRTQPFPTPGTPEDDTYDLVQALLGWAPLEPPKTRLASRTKQEKALRSRVRFGFAMSGNAQMTAPKSYAATRPRASYWPFYLKPNGDNKARHPFDFNNEQAILSGRKRYVARGGTDSLPQVSDQGSASAEGRDERMNSAVTFLKEGALFSGEIRFRSISAIELGALVWAITFGDLEGKHGYRHMMGRAKAFGYGQVRARISGSGDLDLQGALNAFTDWVSLQMDQPFETLPQIRSLRAMASPEIGKQQAHLLKYPEHGSGGSSAERVLAGYQELKTKATNTRGQYGGKTIQETSALGLPEYPDIGQTGTSKT